MGLAQTVDNYVGVVECLKECYDRPLLIHQAHVRSILESTSLKEGKSKELCHLHDVVNQNMRTTSAKDLDKFEFLITAIIELKLDQNTMFKWQ